MSPVLNINPHIPLESKNEVMRPLHYQSTDIFFICFSTVDPISYRNVRKKWWPEVVRFSPDTPVILVGTKTDLRANVRTLKRSRSSSVGASPITRSLGLQLMKEIGEFMLPGFFFQNNGASKMFYLRKHIIQ